MGQIKEKFKFMPVETLQYCARRMVNGIKFKHDVVRLTKANYISFQLYRNALIHKLKKKYKKQIIEWKEQIEKDYASLPHEHPKQVWVCWFQGMEDAPKIVKACFNSIKKHLGSSAEITLITKDNYSEYVEFPDYINKKIKDNKLSLQFLSDLIRLELLTKRGGAWIDATVFCSGDDICDNFWNDDLFIVSSSYLEGLMYATTVESYIISSCQNEKMLSLLKMLMYDFVKNYTAGIDYLIIYDLFELVIDAYREDWSKVYPYMRANTLTLHGIWRLPFDKDDYTNITRNNPFHKLSFRYDVPSDGEAKGSYYDYIVTTYGD